MNRLSSRQRCVVLAALLAVMTASPPAPAGDPAPGLLMRLYKVDTPMHALADLRPGQLPNVARAVETLDLSAKQFAPLTDQFITEIEGFVEIEQAGRYAFRLMSDDGSKLWIDGQLVVDHDGLHGAAPKDGATQLSAGRHTLKVRHFEQGGGERLTLHWRPATNGADAVFAPLPAHLLSHAADASMATAPGVKQIIKPLRRGRPGDGAPVAGLHPGYTEEHRGAKASSRYAVTGARVHLSRGASDAQRDGVIVWIPGRTADSPLTPFLELPNTPHPGQFQVQAGGNELMRVQIETNGEVAQGVASRLSSADPLPIPLSNPSGKTTFEMLTVSARSNGFEIEFTKPLDSRVGWDAQSYYVEQWPFDSQKRQPPTRDGSSLPVTSASVSADRKTVFLEIKGLKSGCVTYIRLLPPCVSADGELPWSTEAWYTLNAIPDDRPGTVRTPPPAPPQNVLSEAEKAAGWELLFDGKSTEKWRGYRKDQVPDGWQMVDQCLKRVGPGGDIMTREQFANFELVLDWRIGPGGNSGIIFRVDESLGASYESGPEMQVLDNEAHADAGNSTTSAGANYALHPVTKNTLEPVGLFNRVKLVVNGPHVEHWLNGEKVVEYELWSEDWEQRVAASKFGKMPKYGRMKRGHIVLQDHGDPVWYRNIKIRRLPDGGVE